MTAAAAPSTLRDAVNAYLAEAAKVEQGGGPSGIERQHRHGRLTARERSDLLLDKGTPRLECGLLSAWNMYREYGGAPAAGRRAGVAALSNHGQETPSQPHRWPPQP